MKIAEFNIFRYDLPLTNSLRIGGQTIRQRSGLILRIADKYRHAGLGEIAPLPGVHREDLAGVQRQLRQICKRLVHKSFPEELAGFNGAFDSWLKGVQLFPSVRYGVELALLNLLVRRVGKPLCALFSPEYRRRISLNGLLNGTKKEIEGQIEVLAEEKCPAVKLKVGRLGPEEEIELVHSLREALPASMSMRLDANRCWSLETALSFGRAIAGCRIEYIEEPLADPAGLEQFYRETGVPVALDETLVESSPGNFQPFGGLVALVLKPAVLGGVEKTMQMGRMAGEYQLKAVISSTFESGLGLAAAANLAACLNEEDVPAGLGTCKWLREDLLPRPFCPEGYQVDVEDADYQSRRLRMSHLEKIF